MLIDKYGAPLATSRGTDSAWNAASFRDQFKNWQPSVGSADADNLYEMDDIRFRARDADRNQSTPRAHISALVQHVVGSHLRVIPKPNYRALGKTKAWADKWTQIVQAKAQAYFDSTDVDAAGIDDITSMTALSFQSVLVNGGVLKVPVWRERVAPHRATNYRTAFKLVEIDRLSNPDGRMDDEFLRGGIEIDEDGEPFLYHVMQHHPGDIWNGYMQKWEAIPAYTEWGRQRLMHIYSRDRVDQHRGVAWLATSMRDYKTADDMQRHELAAAAANAMIAFTVESAMPAEVIADVFGGAEGYLAARAAHKAAFGPNKVVGLFPGDKLNSFATNRPNSNFGSFMDSTLRAPTAAGGLPLELVLRNFTTMNYSSMRGMMLEAERTFSTFKSWIVRRDLKPSYQLWFEEAVDKGEIPDCTFEELYESGNWSAWTDCSWLGDGSGWVDPVKEAQGQQMRMANGTSSLERECAERGIDWRENADQLATEVEYYHQRGLIHPAERDMKPVGPIPEEHAKEQYREP
jgi:lambda family phage portal protein